MLEGIKRGGGYPPGTELANQAYFEAAGPSDVDRLWPSLVAAEPYIVKLYLQYSEEYDRRASNAEFFGKRGLSPASFRRAVELARRDPRRVALHVTSAADFHVLARRAAAGRNEATQRPIGVSGRLAVSRA